MSSTLAVVAAGLSAGCPSDAGVPRPDAVPGPDGGGTPDAAVAFDAAVDDDRDALADPDTGPPDAAAGCPELATRGCEGPGGCAGTELCSAGVWGSCTCEAPVEEELDLHAAMVFDNPADLADWPVGTTITAVEFQPGGQDGVRVDFARKDGPERWPDITPPGWEGPLQYTLGMALRIDGQWYASAAIQFWYGLEQSGGNVALDDQVARNWYYDGRWGPMAGYQPTTGETIGIFVVAGNVRGVGDDSQSPVRERSNVVLVPMPDVVGARHEF